MQRNAEPSGALSDRRSLASSMELMLGEDGGSAVDRHVG